MEAAAQVRPELTAAPIEVSGGHAHRKPAKEERVTLQQACHIAMKRNAYIVRTRGQKPDYIVTMQPLEFSPLTHKIVGYYKDDEFVANWSLWEGVDMISEELKEFLDAEIAQAQARAELDVRQASETDRSPVRPTAPEACHS